MAHPPPPPTKAKKPKKADKIAKFLQDPETVDRLREQSDATIWSAPATVQPPADTPTSKLTCQLCKWDSTIPKDRQRSYTLNELDHYLATGVHTRKEELRRALNIELDARGGEVPCLLCESGKVYKEFTPFLKHLEKSHPEYLVTAGTEAPIAREGDDGDEEGDETDVLA